MSAKNKALVLEVYNSFQAGRLDKLVSMMDPNIEWTLPEIEEVPFGGKKHGVAEVMQFLKMVNDLQKVLSRNITDIVTEDDTVIVFGNYSWLVRWTKRDFSCDFAHVFTVRDGKIVAFREYTDTAAIGAAYMK